MARSTRTQAKSDNLLSDDPINMTAPIQQSTLDIINAPEYNDNTTQAKLRLGIYCPNGVPDDFGYQTDESSCFDLHADLRAIENIIVYTELNHKVLRKVINNSTYIDPGDRALVPTGMWFDIPSGYSIRIHPRSGISLKFGITLGNAEAVIDSDYTDQTYIMLYNSSKERYNINSGDRIAQGEIYCETRVDRFDILNEKPVKDSNRAGGFGSTGK